jgi:2-octaprenyl-6-methoxyphenol hydroxylase
MISQRLALVGDAAHAVHPIAGQGLNAGFKDVAALAEVLCNARRRGQDLGVQTALEEYQRWRRFDNAILSLATNGFNRLFSNNNPISRGLRDLGMGLINNSHSIRRAFVANAAGTAGEVPKLMQGSRL